MTRTFDEPTDYLSDLSPEMLELASRLREVVETSVFMVAPYLREAARTRPDYDLKQDYHDIVTEHDRHVEDLMRTFFAQAVPGSTVLGEEAGEQGETSPVASETVDAAVDSLTAETAAAVAGLGDRVRFIVDPIDGTANFASGLAHFGSSVAAEVDGTIVAAAVSMPCLREAIVGDATTVWHVLESGERTPVTSSGPREEREALALCYYPRRKYLEHDPMGAANKELAIHTEYSVVRRTGAGALDLANVAAGWAGLLIGTRFAPWDVAAGIHLVRAAGGYVLNLPMDTDLPDGMRPAVVASVGTLDAVTAKWVLRDQQRIVDEDGPDFA